MMGHRELAGKDFNGRHPCVFCEAAGHDEPRPFHDPFRGDIISRAFNDVVRLDLPASLGPSNRRRRVLQSDIDAMGEPTADSFPAFLELNDVFHAEIVKVAQSGMLRQARAESLAREHALLSRRNFEIVLADTDSLRSLPGGSLIRRPQHADQTQGAGRIRKGPNNAV